MSERAAEVYLDTADGTAADKGMLFDKVVSAKQGTTV